MEKEQLEKRLLEVNELLEQSAANHNALIIGRKFEIQSLLADLFVLSQNSADEQSQKESVV